MADHSEPPPLFDDDDNEEKAPENEDLFASASEDLDKKAEHTPKENGRVDDEDDLFAGGGTEVLLNDEDDKPKGKATHEENSTSATINTQSVTSSAATEKIVTKPVATKTEEQIEEEEKDDKMNIEITITDPKKIGDGMGSYMAYKVITKTTIPLFRKREFSVYRRFSDFLGVHEKLAGKHQHYGHIIPPPPEKSLVGMTKIKMSKEDQGSGEFVEKRRAALERYVNRTAKHPILVKDPDFRDFIEQEGDLPKATNTSALSGAGMMRLFSKMGDSLGKMTFKMDESDPWFEEKQQQVESLDNHLRKLHSSIEALCTYRKELAMQTGSFAKSAAMLGNAEEHTALSRALSQLAEVEEKIDQLHLDQADSDFFVFAELIKDYISLIGSVKNVFAERVKIYKNWKEAELTLGKKRENKAKLELQHKTDKIAQAQQEINEWEGKVEKGQEDFEKISKQIRTEMVRFEKQRVKDFKNTIVNYLESLMNSQQQVIKYWEAFLPEAKAIA